MKVNDYTGYKIGMLTVIEKTDRRNKQGRILYKCKCECGNIVYYNSSDFKKNVSCGCWRKSRKRIDKMMSTMQYVENTSIALIKKTTLNTNNTSGFKGVSYDKTRNKWRAYIRLQYKTIELGRFDTFKKAVRARLEAEDRYYKPIIEKYKKENKEQEITCPICGESIKGYPAISRIDNKTEICTNCSIIEALKTKNRS